MKDTVRTMKREGTDRQKIFADDTSDKELFYKTHKELLKLNSKKTTQFLKRAKVLNRHLRLQIENKHLKRCSLSSVIREIKIKNNNETISYRLACYRLNVCVPSPHNFLTRLPQYCEIYL